MAVHKAKCTYCSRKVDIGSFTGTYSLHKDNSNVICPGSSKQIPKALLPLDKLRNSKKLEKKKKFPKESSGSLIAQFEINQKETIKRSMADERAVKDAQRNEFGSNQSVKTISGGLPTLGKKN